MQETIIRGPTCPSMQKHGGGSLGGIPLQSAHAAMHREVELTERRLEASSKPSRVEVV